jgi:hypothetical protein
MMAVMSFIDRSRGAADSGNREHIDFSAEN